MRGGGSATTAGRPAQLASPPTHPPAPALPPNPPRHAPRRDRAYWAACYKVLAAFWWEHVVPALHAREAGRDADVQRYRWGCVGGGVHAQAQGRVGCCWLVRRW